MSKNFLKIFILIIFLCKDVITQDSPHFTMLIESKNNSLCQICHRVHSRTVSFLSPAPKSIKAIDFAVSKGYVSSRDLLCLKCHTNRETLKIEFPELITSVREACFLGKDLRDEHPLELSQYIKVFNSLSGEALPLSEDNKILCITCHNPHKSSFPYLLRGPQTELCLSCHQNLSFDSLCKNTECGNCHQLHNNSNRFFINYKNMINTCLNCHPDEHRSLPVQSIISDYSPFKNFEENREFLGQECSKCHNYHKKRDGF